jgi:aminoglycoside phosphotransferase (APT) family kinase protein
VREHVPPGDFKLVFSPTPTGKYNTSYYVDGWKRPLVLRIAPPDAREQNLFYEFRMMRQEPEIHALVRLRTNAPVATIIAHAAPHPLIGRDFLLMDRLPGSPISSRTMGTAAFKKLLFQVGRAMAQVHAITRDEYGYVGPHRPMEPQKDWSGAFPVMWHKLIDDTVSCGGYSTDDADLMRRLLDKHLEAFRRPVASSLLHMDIWAENILCDGSGGLTGLLDWDRALWGDPEIEFAVLDYCGISEPAFWDGYGKNRDTSRGAEIRRLFYLLYEVQKYIFIHRVRSGSASEADEYRRQSLSLAKTIGCA